MDDVAAHPELDQIAICLNPIEMGTTGACTVERLTLDMRIWNLTPHPMLYDDGTNQRVMPTDGNCRVQQIDQSDEPIDGMATVQTQYAGVEGIPTEVQSGDVLIVSTIVADAFARGDRPVGVTVLVPDTGSTCKRDAQGRIVSVSRFIRR